jgi:hypothetical protein
VGAFNVRHSHATVVHDAKAYVMGGYDGNGVIYSDVYASNLGDNWQLVTATAGFGQRFYHNAVSFNGEIFVMGGIGNLGGTVQLNDIWRSADGVSWSQVTANAPYATRRLFGATVHNGEIWIVGGTYHEAPRAHGDAWHSANGSTWARAADSLFGNGRASFPLISYGGALWVIGGADGAWVDKNDVWKSNDGISWTQVTDSAAFAPRSGHSGVVYANRMWITGGNKAGVPYGDVWSSVDGATWTMATDSAGWNPRWWHTSVNLDNTMWVIGGTKGGYNNDFRDVWRSP